MDLRAERKARAQSGRPEGFVPADLYPDVRPCLDRLKAAGYFLGVSGNTSATTERVIRDAGLPFALIASSQGWRVSKPDPVFFTRVAESTGLALARIAYVGDRLDNDVLPAKAVGMFAVCLTRGPWAEVHAGRPAIAAADAVIDSLVELPAALA